MTPLPEELVEARRWMGRLPRDQFDLLLVLLRDAEARAVPIIRARALEEAAAACEAHRYAGRDDMRNICKLREEHRNDIANAIRALKESRHV